MLFSLVLSGVVCGSALEIFLFPPEEQTGCLVCWAKEGTNSGDTDLL